MTALLKYVTRPRCNPNEFLSCTELEMTMSKKLDRNNFQSKMGT